jgi:hypothetical protein
MHDISKPRDRPHNKKKKTDFNLETYLPRTLTCNYQQGIQEPEKYIKKTIRIMPNDDNTGHQI